MTRMNSHTHLHKFKEAKEAISGIYVEIENYMKECYNFTEEQMKGFVTTNILLFSCSRREIFWSYWEGYSWGGGAKFIKNHKYPTNHIAEPYEMCILWAVRQRFFCDVASAPLHSCFKMLLHHLAYLSFKPEGIKIFSYLFLNSNKFADNLYGLVIQIICKQSHNLHQLVTLKIVFSGIHYLFSCWVYILSVFLAFLLLRRGSPRWCL